MSRNQDVEDQIEAPVYQTLSGFQSLASSCSKSSSLARPFWSHFSCTSSGTCNLPLGFRSHSRLSRPNFAPWVSSSLSLSDPGASGGATLDEARGLAEAGDGPGCFALGVAVVELVPGELFWTFLAFSISFAIRSSWACILAFAYMDGKFSSSDIQHVEKSAKIPGIIFLKTTCKQNQWSQACFKESIWELGSGSGCLPLWRLDTGGAGDWTTSGVLSGTLGHRFPSLTGVSDSLLDFPLTLEGGAAFAAAAVTGADEAVFADLGAGAAFAAVGADFAGFFPLLAFILEFFNSSSVASTL